MRSRQATAASDQRVVRCLQRSDNFTSAEIVPEAKPLGRVVHRFVPPPAG